MRPKHLKCPFNWKERHVLIEDRIWYVPERFNDYASFTFPGWHHPQMFDRLSPICVEFCSGNGAWIAEKAQLYPDRNWVAVERNFDRVRKIWSKIKNFQLTNLLTVSGEGYSVTKNYLPSSSVHEVYINFPDPWPKTRHAKKRIVQTPFIAEVNRILVPGGTLTLVTDDEDHSQWMISVLQKVTGFQSVLPSPFYTEEYPDYGTSYFEDLWREKGKSIRYHVFRKIELNANS